jgi:hypothetical protein
MPITITKKLQVTKPLTIEAENSINLIDPVEMDLEELADSYGALNDRCNALLADPVFIQFDEVKKEFIERLVKGYEPTDALQIKGKHWLLEIGPSAKNPAKLNDLPSAMKMLGQEVFNKIAKVNLGDLTKYLNPEQYAKVVNTDTGYSKSRKIVSKYLG